MVMQPYHDLLRHVLEQGIRKPTRARIGETKIDALSIFGYQNRYDLRAGFPAITTKKLAWNAVVHELIWFLRGSSNVSYLRENKVTIWDEWADANGDLGPVYGKQWRHWVGPDGHEVDQIANLVAGIQEVKRDAQASVGRRLIVSAWNPAEIAEMALPPCHTLFQMMVTEGTLSCQLYQRSADLFLGVPFNIASYALLTHLVAHVTGLSVGEFVHSYGDAHIYVNHVEQVRAQLERDHFPPPTLWIDPALSDLGSIRREQIKLQDYRHHPPLVGEVAV